jgi:hypothetical protein
LDKVLDRGYSLFGVFEFGRDPKSSTTDQLIVLDINDAARYVSVHDVKGEVQCFWTKTKGEVNFHQEVDETGSHVPPDLRLLIHRLSRRHSITLHIEHIITNFVPVLLLQKDAFSTKGLYLGLTLPLLHERDFGRARRPSGKSIGGEQWRLMGFRNAMRGWAFLWVDERVAGMFVRCHFFHLEINRVGRAVDRLGRIKSG